MAEIRLGDLRIGYAYGVTVNFPTGFLTADESLKASLRRYRGQLVPAAIFTTDRIEGTQQVELSLTAEQTANLTPGSYISELVVTNTADLTSPDIPLSDNVYILEADYSPSEA